MDEEPGLTLQQAVEQYTDRAIWTAYADALDRAQGCRVRDRSLYIHRDRVSGLSYDCADDATYGRVAREWNRLVDASEEAGMAVSRDLWEKLYRGELVATGWEWPVGFDSQRRQIPRHIWLLVGPNYRESSAEGNGIKIVDIRIRRTADICDERTESPAAIPDKDNQVRSENTAATMPETMIPPRRRGGRPGVPDEVGAEMRRRAVRREIEPSLAREATYLEKWWANTHPKARPFKSKSIQNRFRGLYNELTA